MKRALVVVFVYSLLVLPSRSYAFTQDTSFTLTALVDMDAVNGIYQANLVYTPSWNLVLIDNDRYNVSFVAVGQAYEMASYLPDLSGKHLWSLSYDAISKDVTFRIDGTLYNPYWTNGQPVGMFGFLESDLFVDHRYVVQGSVDVLDGVLSSSQLESIYNGFLSTPLSRIYSSAVDYVGGFNSYTIPVLSVLSSIGLLFAGYFAVRKGVL